MAQDAGKLAQEWFEKIWNDRDENHITAKLAADALYYSSGSNDRLRGEDFKNLRKQMLEAFPNVRLRVEQCMSQGDEAAVRWLVQCDPGSDGPEFWGITWLRFKDGNLVAGWDAYDETSATLRLQAALAASKA